LPVSQRLKGKSRLMQGILVFQFSLSMLTILTGIVFADNARFIETLDLGFDTQQTIAVPLQNTGAFEALKNAVIQQPHVQTVSGTRHLIGYNQGTYTVKSGSHEIRAAILDGDVDERQAVGLRLTKGRDFEKRLSTDTYQSLIVSEKLVKELDLREPLGAWITVDSSNYKIVGVMQDFYNRSVWRPAQPTAIRLTTPDRFRYLVVRVEGSHLQEVNEFLRARWGQLVPNIPYEGFYQNELVQDALVISSNIRLVFLCVSGAAISIAAMGLFALSSLIVVRRTKEIGVRKVLGASVFHIIRILNHQVSFVLLLSIFLAATAGSFVIRIFLDSLYAYHIELQLWHHLLAAAIIILVGFVSVSSQVYRVAATNPVESLRYE
jgi:putative ABC transport system permease protein